MASREKDTKYLIKPNFHDEYPFSKKIFATEIAKTKINMNKPVYPGQKIFALRKTLIYEFHYNYMQLKYGSKVKLCYLILCI